MDGTALPRPEGRRPDSRSSITAFTVMARKSSSPIESATPNTLTHPGCRMGSSCGRSPGRQRIRSAGVDSRRPRLSGPRSS